MSRSTDSAEPRAAHLVAILLAVGIATAVNLITLAALYDAIASKGPGLSENATQILTTAFGGMIGVLGGYVGYRAGTVSAARRNDEPPAAELGRGDGGPDSGILGERPESEPR